jgi:hypothetical protein
MLVCKKFRLGYGLAEPNTLSISFSEGDEMKVSRFSQSSSLGRSTVVTRFLTIALFLLFAVGSVVIAQQPPGGGGGGAPNGVANGTPAAQNPFENVRAVTCAVARALTGPVGIAIGFLVLVGGLIAMQVANRDAIPMITRAVAGTALLIGAGAAFAAIVTDSSCFS